MHIYINCRLSQYILMQKSQTHPLQRTRTDAMFTADKPGYRWAPSSQILIELTEITPDVPHPRGKQIGIVCLASNS